MLPAIAVVLQGMTAAEFKKLSERPEHTPPTRGALLEEAAAAAAVLRLPGCCCCCCHCAAAYMSLLLQACCRCCCCHRHAAAPFILPLLLLLLLLLLPLLLLLLLRWLMPPCCPLLPPTQASAAPRTTSCGSAPSGRALPTRRRCEAHTYEAVALTYRAGEGLHGEGHAALEQHELAAGRSNVRLGCAGQLSSVAPPLPAGTAPTRQ